ncbi:MAG: DNA mismatch endonuclease Vsr [Albidovulum sp.]|nr:DNA mismatch endonuclease Vsr [Albidovulum sp.]
MTDIVDTQRRSELMAGIRGRDTAPEIAVRRIAHRMGLRFRVHRKDLPGRPDLVFPKHRLAVFVHGCFWHRHEGCRFASDPKSRVAFWKDKFAANVDRDARQQAVLRELGWSVLVIWECETRNERAVERMLAASVRRGSIGKQQEGDKQAPLLTESGGPDVGIHVVSAVTPSSGARRD